MDFNEYQLEAATTDQHPENREHALMIPILGLAGEAGTLASEYKKFLRDGPAHKLINEQVCEELGDILWYISNVASKFGLKLDDVAQYNLKKVRDRFLGTEGPTFFDACFPETEQLPREFEICFSEKGEQGNLRVAMTWNGQTVGNPLTDAAYDDDGYRYHDVFHLSYATYLAWSPVTRRNLKRKRRSDKRVDEVEDGGRAWVFEEAIAALCYDHARKHNFYVGIDSLDFDLLKTIKSLTSGLEVRVRSAREWESAILAGYRVWQKLCEHRGGYVKCDLSQRLLQFREA